MKTIVPWTLFLCSAVLLPATPARVRDLRGGDVALVPAPVVLESEAGQAALDEVGDHKRAAYALSGSEREERLLDVAREYGAVADNEAFGLRERAEASFRAGEILRAREQAEAAARRFQQATTLGEGSTDEGVRAFGARGLLELAHAERRAGALEGALGLYAEVHVRYPEQQRSRSHAISWSGKLLLKEGRLDEAREALLTLEPFLPDAALEAIKNVEGLVEAFQEAGRAEEAVEAVRRLERELQAGLGADGPLAPELGSALAALRDKVGASGY